MYLFLGGCARARGLLVLGDVSPRAIIRRDLLGVVHLRVKLAMLNQLQVIFGGATLCINLLHAFPARLLFAQKV